MSTFNELIDFTRSTTGTYLDSVVYGDELVTNGDFATDSDWIKTGNLTAISNGTATIGETAGNGSIRQEDSLIVGKSYIVKFDITAISSASAFLAFRNDGFSSVGSAVISFGSNLSISTYSQVFVATGSVVNFTVGGGNSSLAIDNISVKEVIGGQVSGTPLLRTAAINEPRLEYDASGNPLGLLIEQARTNLVTSSLFNTAYQDQSVTRVLNQSGAPDGTSTATKVLETGGTAFHRTFALMFFSSGSTYTQSVYAKSIGGRALQLTLGASAFGGIHVNFDLENGAVGSNVGYTSASITDAGNGWYRCVATTTASQSYGTDSSIVSVTSPTSGRLESFAGDTSKGLLVFGHQVETGAFPTSYIPTSGSTVTRAKDVSDVPVERFGYNTAKGSIVVYAQSNKPATSVYAFELSADFADRMFSKFHDGEHLRVRVNNADTAIIDAGNIATGELAKLGARFANNDFAVSIDGNTPVTDTNGAVNLNASVLKIGQSLSNGEHLNGHIKQIQYYPKRLSNTELQLLTQPSASPTMNLTFDGQATSTLVEGLHD